MEIYLCEQPVMKSNLSVSEGLSNSQRRRYVICLLSRRLSLWLGFGGLIFLWGNFFQVGCFTEFYFLVQNWSLEQPLHWCDLQKIVSVM